jgi:hypothetical protein
LVRRHQQSLSAQLTVQDQTEQVGKKDLGSGAREVWVVFEDERIESKLFGIFFIIGICRPQE